MSHAAGGHATLGSGRQCHHPGRGGGGGRVEDHTRTVVLRCTPVASPGSTMQPIRGRGGLAHSWLVSWGRHRPLAGRQTDTVPLAGAAAGDAAHEAGCGARQGRVGAKGGSRGGMGGQGGAGATLHCYASSSSQCPLVQGVLQGELAEMQHRLALTEARVTREQELR